MKKVNDNLKNLGTLKNAPQELNELKLNITKAVTDVNNFFSSLPDSDDDI